MDYKNEFISLVNLYPNDIDTYLTEPLDSERLIGIAEKMIGHRFPNSYKDFLREFGYAVIFGEEIYSLYSDYYKDEMDNTISYPGDIAFVENIHRKRPNWDRNVVEICHTGFDDRLFFDYRFFHEDTGECDIFVLLPGGPLTLYAKDFYEFLCKRVYEYIK
jgi:hypothetical protein